MIGSVLLVAAMLLAEAPMTDEEVVRRVTAGEPVDAILADVKRRPPAFDVSEEMLAELRRTGVPEALLAAMIARAAEAAPKPAVPEPAATPPPAPAPPMAELRLRPDDPTLTVSRRLEPQRIAELELPAGALEADALALAVLCTTRNHDDPGAQRWPEGRVPKELTQARVVGFFPATEAGRSGKQLRVALGESVAVPLQADLSHDLLVAVVMRAGGAWTVLGGDELRGARAAEGASVAADLTVKGTGGDLRVTVRRPKDASLPDLPRGQGWAKSASFAARDAGGRGQSLSPDGRKRVLVGRDGATLEIEGQAAGELALPAPGDTDVLWSPDSGALALTGGSPSGSAVTVWRLEADDTVRPLPLPEAAKGIQTLAAVGFSDDGSRLLVVSLDGGRLSGYLVKISDGTLAARFTELEVRTRWGDRLGPRLR